MGLKNKKNICNINDQPTFNGYPTTMEYIDGEVYITCKGVTGSLTQGDLFLKNKSKDKYYFGKSRIRRFSNKEVKIDCLRDTLKQFKLIHSKAKTIKAEHLNKEINGN